MTVGTHDRGGALAAKRQWKHKAKAVSYCATIVKMSTADEPMYCSSEIGVQLSRNNVEQR